MIGIYGVLQLNTVVILKESCENSVLDTSFTRLSLNDKV